jgi:hypothetical protein
MGPTDPYNPDGEELPSDAQAVNIPTTVVMPVDVQLQWTPIAGAKEYRVYRSPTANLPAGQEKLLATLSGNPPPTVYLDSGGGTLPPGPRVPGDTGTWVPLPKMQSSRQGLSVAVLQSEQYGPTQTWFLYALGGRNAAGNVLASYELMTIAMDSNGMPTPQPPWVAGQSTFPPARWQLGSYAVDSKVSTRVPSGTAFVYVVGGIDGGNGVLNDVDAASVTMTGPNAGQLGAFSAEKGISPAAAGMGHEAGANQLFAFGGVGAAASDKNTAAQICGPGSNCPPAAVPPALNNWNTNAALAVPRYLLGTAVESAHFFLVGGHDGNAASDTMESTIW